MKSARTLVFLLSVVTLHATDYFIDQTRGADSNPGITSARAWKTLARIAESDFRPGDRILLKSGSVWRDLVALGATEAEADALTEILHTEGWGGREDASDLSLGNMLAWLRETRRSRKIGGAGRDI